MIPYFERYKYNLHKKKMFLKLKDEKNILPFTELLFGKMNLLPHSCPNHHDLLFCIDYTLQTQKCQNITEPRWL